MFGGLGYPENILDSMPQIYKLVAEQTDFKAFYEVKRQEYLKEKHEAEEKYLKEHKDIQGVYLIQAENGLIKIGKTTDINKRFVSLQSASPYELKLIGFIKTFNESELEASLHDKYKRKCIRGEWFKLDSQDIEEILKHNC